jgi:hypothetical protein
VGKWTAETVRRDEKISQEEEEKPIFCGLFWENWLTVNAFVFVTERK